jgi:hypothetical protein
MCPRRFTQLLHVLSQASDPSSSDQKPVAAADSATELSSPRLSPLNLHVRAVTLREAKAAGWHNQMKKCLKRDFNDGDLDHDAGERGDEAGNGDLHQGTLLWQPKASVMQDLPVLFSFRDASFVIYDTDWCIAVTLSEMKEMVTTLTSDTCNQ